MNIKIKLAALLVAMTFVVSCSDDDDNDAANSGNFILTVTPFAATGVADYLLTASSLDTGKITTEGNGIEQDGTYRYYVTHNNKFFSMLYGQGNPGAVTAYNILDGKLNKLTNFQTETVQAFAPVNDDLLLIKISRNLTAPSSLWYKVNTESLTITSEGTINTLEMTGLEELAHFTWVKQVGNKVFAPYQTIKDRNFNTDYPDQAWIAVFNYADMKLEKVIEDDRTSFIGSYFKDGLNVAENGDVYAYSPSAATTNGELSSTKKSAITRIKAGTTEFDDYYFDVEAASGGMNITSWLYVGNNNYIVHSQTESERTAYPAGLHVGVVNVVDKTYKPVTGLPEVADIVGLTTNNYTPKDGRTGYLGVTLKTGVSYVYKIDVTTQTATRGLEVEGGGITAIQHLD
ncbi:DUF4374 domain-containing protein [Fulvivirgaceae bacterium PWU5]|uniref:DUF4374 domain-containing protein n=1 Tax=Dawidia cretensis TaxID=2782350 RepID=A0AAP2DTH7_9BACT|nr:DUF4374 domain-containing protein [Dawidia cretensis]MBT1707255.1 DUF4374 domain-containing protein [Dawidia cretensis]